MNIISAVVYREKKEARGYFLPFFLLLPLLPLDEVAGASSVHVLIVFHTYAILSSQNVPKRSYNLRLFQYVMPGRRAKSKPKRVVSEIQASRMGQRNGKTYCDHRVSTTSMLDAPSCTIVCHMTRPCRSVSCGSQSYRLAPCGSASVI